MTELRVAVEGPLDAVFTIAVWVWVACVAGCLAFWAWVGVW